jgi:hypothetical protein
MKAATIDEAGGEMAIWYANAARTGREQKTRMVP